MPGPEQFKKSHRSDYDFYEKKIVMLIDVNKYLEPWKIFTYSFQWLLGPILEIFIFKTQICLQLLHFLNLLLNGLPFTSWCRNSILIETEHFFFFKNQTEPPLIFDNTTSFVLINTLRVISRTHFPISTKLWRKLRTEG